MIKSENMKVRIYITLLLATNLCGSVRAQWNWPEDRVKAEGKNAYYTDNLNNGLYRLAADKLSWLLINAPDLNPSIYINGAKIYETLAANESDPGLKLIYQDSALLMYDLRIKYFDKEASVLNRKAYKAYRYYRDRKEKYEELYSLFKRTFELNGNQVLDNNLVAYMDITRRYKMSGGALTDEQVIDIYSEISEVIEFKMKEADNIERLKTLQDNLDKLLTSTITVDCNFVEQTLAPKMADEPENVKLAKKVFQLLLTGKCTDSPFFLKSGKMVHEHEPTYGLGVVIAKKEMAAGNFKVAENYYLQALELTDDNAKKGEIYMDLATSHAAKKNRVTARKYAFKATEQDASLKGAYSLVGILYMQSYDDCRQGVNRVEDRGCYLAAYKMFQKAGNAEGMRNSRQQFPSIEEIFELNLEEGDSFTVGCWIDEKVTIQRRPS